MTFRDWKQLSPTEAAREVHDRVRTRLRPQQQRAVIAYLSEEAELRVTFAAADRTSALGGVPYFLKDLFDVAGLDTLAGSTFLSEVRPTPTTDAAINQQFKTAGAVFCGKTQLHEFAYGITGENAHYGDCEHPAFAGRLSGGSSSGSAAAVAAGIVPLAVGSDTGGSVRVPAAFCGLFGFRLTSGDELIRDAFPLARTFDTAGWFTATAEDMSTTLTEWAPPRATKASPRGCYLELGNLDVEVSEACRAVAGRFAPPADELTRTDLIAMFSNSTDLYNQVVMTEAWDIHQSWADRYRERYDPGVWQRLVRGRTQSRATYNEARQAVDKVRRKWTSYFDAYDFLVLPATPFAAPTKAECTLENRNRLLALTAPASLGGLPVLTIPVPLASGMTTGLQVIAKDPQSGVFSWALTQ